jgi:cytochrome bd ubiquinol oxidase subunit II
MIAQTLTAGVIWAALVAYGVLGGADFGGGIWDLLASGATATRQRALIAAAMGPVWEANNVWLVFAIVGTFTGFPIVFSTLSVALYIPLTLALIGIVLRGAAFVFHAYSEQANGGDWIWGYVFRGASMITPFFFGMCAAAIASGMIHPHGTTDYWRSWTTPFAFACGAFALGICSCLAATYLTIEAEAKNDRDLVEIFRWRAIVAGAATAVVGGLALALSSGDAPVLWHGLHTQGLFFTLTAIVIGLATAFNLLLARYRVARVLLIVEIASIFVAWAVAQFPTLIVPDITIANAASPTATLIAFLVCTFLGMLVLLPSLWLLFRVFKSERTARERHPASGK